MNERIRELAEQVGIGIWGDAVFMFDPKNTLDSNTIKKFAELIVQECADLMNSNKDSDKHVMWNRALYETRGKILRHFGVGE